MAPNLNLIEIVTNTLVDAVQMNGANNYYVLVCDATVEFVMDHLNENVYYEGVRRNIAAIRYLSKEKKVSYVDLPALYIVEPTEENLKQIYDDFQSQKSYQRATVHFTMSVDNKLADKYLRNPDITIGPEVSLSLAPIYANVAISNDRSIMSQVALADNFSDEFSSFAAKVAATMTTLAFNPTSIFVPKSSHSCKAFGQIIQSLVTVKGGHRNDKMIIISRDIDVYSLLALTDDYISLSMEVIDNEEGNFTFSAGGTETTTSIFKNDYFLEKMYDETIQKSQEFYRSEAQEQVKAMGGTKGGMSANAAADNFLRAQVVGVKSRILQAQGKLHSLAIDFSNKAMQLKLAQRTIMLEEPLSQVDEVKRLINSPISDCLKMRLIGWHIVKNNGIPQDEFNELLRKSGLNSHGSKALKNLAKLNCKVISESPNPRAPAYSVNLNETQVLLPTIAEYAHQISKNKIPDAMEELKSLGTAYSVSRMSVSGKVALNGKMKPVKRARLLIVVVGGVMPCEIAATTRQKIGVYDLIILSNHLIKPKFLIDELADL